MIMRYFLLISGVSGSGKTFIESKINGSSVHKNTIMSLTQVTTRKPRDKEELLSKDYLFIDNYFYDKLYNSSLLIASSSIGKTKYGTLDYSRDNYISSIIVNAKGYLKVIDDLEKKYDRDSYKIIHLNITSNHTDERDGRNLDKEKEDLKSIIAKQKSDLFLQVLNNYDEEEDNDNIDKTKNLILKALSEFIK